MGFTGNNKGIRLAIVVLLIVFACGALGLCSRSEAAEPSGLSIGFGKALGGSEPCFNSMLIAQEIAEQRWLAFLATHGDSDSCRGEVMDANVGAGILRATQLNHWSIGFGAAVFEHGDLIVGPKSLEQMWPPRSSEGMQFGAAISVRRYIGKRLVVDMLHFSTGGSAYFNPGLNSLTIGIRL